MNNLLKKIWKTAAAGILGMGLLAGMGGSKKDVYEAWDKQMFTGMAKSIREVPSEEQKYGILLFYMEGNGNVDSRITLAWDTDKDKHENIRGEYRVAARFPDNDIFVEAEMICEDKDGNHSFEGEKECFLKDEEYQTFLLANMGRDYLLLKKDKSKSGWENRRYYYKKIGRALSDEIFYTVYRLIGIQDDLNYNKNFEDDEFVWEEKP